MVEARERHDTDIGQQLVPLLDVVEEIELPHRRFQLLTAIGADNGLLLIQHPAVLGDIADRLIALLDKFLMAGQGIKTRHATRQRLAATPDEYLKHIPSAGIADAEVGQPDACKIALHPLIDPLRQWHLRQYQTRIGD